MNWIKKYCVLLAVLTLAMTANTTRVMAFVEQKPPTTAERQRAYLSLFNQHDAKNFPALMNELVAFLLTVEPE